MDITGASGAIERRDIKRQETHAKLFYNEVRKRTADVETIARNTGFSVEDVESVKRHIFLDYHDLGDEEPERFNPSYDMAISWQRLIDGKDIREMDIVLLQHELHELRLMEKGLSYRQAHDAAEKLHNYSKFIKELDAMEGLL